MNKLFSFVFLVAIGLILWVSALVLLLLALLIHGSFNEHILYLSTALIIWLIANFLLSHIYYHPFKESSYQKRNIDYEKKTMNFLVTTTYIVALFSLTVVFYIALKISLNKVPELETYSYILIAAATGGFWGAGMHEMNAFLTWSKYGRKFEEKFDWANKGRKLEWYTRKSFFENLQIMKKRFIIANIAFIFLGFIVMPIIDRVFQVID